MERYNVTGMSCAACSARVEKAVLKVPGVKSCTVSLLTNSMSVEGSASPEKIISAVKKAGYGAETKNSGKEKKSSQEIEGLSQKEEIKKIRNRLISSLIILIPLMYVSMGNMLWSWPLPPFMNGNHIAVGLYQLVFTVLVMVINQKFFVSGFKAIIHRTPNMDSLVALGSSASFLYSLFALFKMTYDSMNGNHPAVMQDMDSFYFESAAMILTLITLGKLLEAISKGKTTDALKALINLAPQKAILLKDGIEKEVNVEEINVGDIFAVKPGQSVPVDGIVIEGQSSVNEACLTGESLPCDKEKGSKVFAATINQSGYLLCQASRVGQDTSLAQIIQLVSDAASTKAPVAKIADKVSGIFVPSVILISILTFTVWLLCGQNISFALTRAVSVLVISCPCSLGLATPVAIMVANGMGAKNGILFKNAAAMEEAGKSQIIVFDKTGTITKGQMQVQKVIPLNGFSEKSLLEEAFSLERKSQHPIAKAICEKAKTLNLNFSEVEDFKSLAGNGLCGQIDKKNIACGKFDFIKNFVELDSETKDLCDTLSEKGMTPLYFVEEKKLAGIIAVSDQIKDEVPEAIRQLKNMGLYTLMLTGDSEKTAKAIAKEAGLDEVAANLLPDDKEKIIQHLMAKGKVMMVGDGINDAPALTRANTGVAIGDGSDIALDAAQIVLIKNKISDLVAAIRLSKKALKNIHENLFWAFFYNIIGIPLAAGLFVNITGWTLNPMFAAAAMSLSSFCVVTNALRLNLFNMYKNHKGKKNSLGIKNSIKEKKLLSDIPLKEEKIMTIKVKGMMCQHCEAHVKEALEKVENVVSAKADHEKGIVELETKGQVSLQALKDAVTSAGYEFVE